MPMTEDSHLENIRAIAELKTQVANVAADVSTVVKQLEMLWQIQTQMSRIQQEQIDHKDSIMRSFVRIESAEKTVSGVKETAEKWINRGIGGFVVGSILFGFIQYLVLARVDNYDGTQRAHGELLTTLDRRMAWVEYELKQKRKELQP